MQVLHLLTLSQVIGERSDILTSIPEADIPGSMDITRCDRRCFLEGILFSKTAHQDPPPTLSGYEL
jgi:hypothetical protein